MMFLSNALSVSCHLQLRGSLSLASFYEIELDEFHFHRFVLSWTCVNFCCLQHHNNKEFHGFSACCMEKQLIFLFCHLI